jgi:hypothetical protein
MRCPKCNTELRLTVAGQSQSASPRIEGHGGIGELLGLIDYDSLDDKSRPFVEQTSERLEKYGEDRLRITELQLKWLKKLAGVE